jgi:hypothetical protein
VLLGRVFVIQLLTPVLVGSSWHLKHRINEHQGEEHPNNSTYPTFFIKQIKKTKLSLNEINAWLVVIKVNE